MLIEMLLIVATQLLGNDFATQLRAVLKRLGQIKARRTKCRLRKPSGTQAASANVDAAHLEQPASRSN